MAMLENNKKCLVCGKVYTYCGSCAEYRNKPTWMTTFHSDNCRQIFNTISAYIAKAITAEEARKRLKKCDLADKAKFSQKLQDAITEIFSETVVEEVDNQSSEVSEVVENTVETSTVNYNYKKSKNRYKQ